MSAFRRFASPVALALALSVALLVPATAIAASQVSIPIVGTALGGGTFSGVFTLTSFAIQNGQVVALGTVSGVLTTASGVIGSALANVALPVDIGRATCEILHLDLGPLSLDLLGLQVDLSRIVLDITAQAGAGNLLGNLLCAVGRSPGQPERIGEAPESHPVASLEGAAADLTKGPPPATELHRDPGRSHHFHLTITPVTSRQTVGAINTRRGAARGPGDTRLNNASMPRPTPAPIAPKTSAPRAY
jgi:hypothetical protein